MGRLMCGASKADITPAPELMEHLAALGNRQIAGVIDRIYLRVIAVGDGDNTVLLITCDLDKVPGPDENIKAISEATGITEDAIFQVSIHTHTAPIAGYRPDEGPNFLERKPVDVQEASAVYETFVREKMVEASKNAVAAMVPAKMGYAKGECFLNVNRVQDYVSSGPDGNQKVTTALGYNPLREADKTLFVMEFRNEEDRLLAVYTNYAMHNCCMIANNYKDGKIGISADIGGNASKYIEEANPGAIAMWTSGAAGDINPIICNELTYPDPLTGEPMSYDAPDSTFAENLLKILTARHTEDIRRTMRNVRCSVTEAAVRSGVEWSETEGSDGKPFKIRVHGAIIGDLALVGYSGELYSSIGKRLRETAPVKEIVIMNHDASLGARSGYIFDDEALTKDVDFRLPGHRSTRMKPGLVEASLVEATGKLLAELK